MGEKEKQIFSFKICFVCRESSLNWQHFEKLRKCHITKHNLYINFMFCGTNRLTKFKFNAFRLYRKRFLIECLEINSEKKKIFFEERIYFTDFNHAWNVWREIVSWSWRVSLKLLFWLLLSRGNIDKRKMLNSKKI